MNNQSYFYHVYILVGLNLQMDSLVYVKTQHIVPGMR